MPVAVSGKTKIYWEQAGSGPPVLLIMGLSFTLEMWLRILPPLTREYRAAYFDNRGMGRSDVPCRPYSIRQLANDAVAVMDAASMRSAHIIGASMGGMIAQELALRWPERVRSLVLGCTTFSGMGGAWPEFSYAPGGIAWMRKSRAERENAMRRMLYADCTADDLFYEDVKIRSSCKWSYKGFFAQLCAILLWSSYRRLPRITAPTLVIHGDQDHLVPPQNGRKLASRIANARFEIVKDAGHVITTDQPERCTELILEFLAEQEQRNPPEGQG